MDFHTCATLAEAMDLVAWLKGADVFLEEVGEASADVNVQVIVPVRCQAFVEVIFSGVDDE